MELEQFKYKIDNGIMNKDVFDDCLDFIFNNINEKTLVYFAKICRFFKMYYTRENYHQCLLIVDLFKNKLDTKGMNGAYINYCECDIFYTVSEYNRCIESCFKTRTLKDIPESFRIYSECFLVSCLYNVKLYHEALYENTNLLNSITYDLVKPSDKAVVLMNGILINTFLNDYDEVKKYNDMLENLILNEPKLKEELDAISLLHKTLIAIKFEGSYFTSDEVNSILDRYVNDKTNYNMIINFTENSKIHTYIIEALIKKNRRLDAYKICKQYVDYTYTELVDYDFFRLYKDTVDPNNREEYINALIRYNEVLYNQLERENSFVSYYYEKYKNFYQLGRDFNILKHNYNHDPLTKVYSRASFEDIKKDRDFNSLIYIDVNKLKNVNDTMGHTYGDKYLIKFARNIEKAFPNDRIYRIGGDEFLVISDEANKDVLIKRLTELDKLPLFDVPQGDKFSSGVVIRDSNIQIYTAMVLADKILYKVKNDNKKFYEFN